VQVVGVVVGDQLVDHVVGEAGVDPAHHELCPRTRGLMSVLLYCRAGFLWDERTSFR
jgi:hypothetical protein